MKKSELVKFFETAGVDPTNGKAKKLVLEASASWQQQATAWLNKQGITKFNFNPDNSVDIDQDAIFNHLPFKKLPLKINKVNGNFGIYGGMLETLENCPKQVTGNYVITYCNLIDTKTHAPVSVGGRTIIDNQASHELLQQAAPNACPHCNGTGRLSK